MEFKGKYAFLSNFADAKINFKWGDTPLYAPHVKEKKKPPKPITPRTK